MKWRCPQCGKPHERNDPPCDNCGHHKFERAVVPVSTAEEGHEQFIWVCTECGRQHQRNNPPCSRCGNATFEKQPFNYDDFDTGSTPSYFDLIGRLEIGGALVLLGLIAVGVLGFAGIINIPGITPQGPPTVQDVPGNADTIGSVPLADVESELLADLDAGRDTPFERTDGLDAVATYVAQRYVKSQAAGENLTLSREVLSRFDTQCSGLPTLSLSATMPPSGSEVTAGDLAETVRLFPIGQSGEPPGSATATRIGIDAHASPDGALIVATAHC